MGSMIDFKRPDGSTCKGYLAEAGKDKPGVVEVIEVIDATVVKVLVSVKLAEVATPETEAVTV